MGDPIEHPIIYFDGVCGLCNRFVDFVLRRDRRALFRFTPLQGESARSLSIPLSPEGEPGTVVLKDQGQLYFYSDAVVRILIHLGGFWKCVGRFGGLIPRSSRDGLYRFIAKHRYQWFGKRTACRLPTVEERSRFLD